MTQNQCLEGEAGNECVFVYSITWIDIREMQSGEVS